MEHRTIIRHSIQATLFLIRRYAKSRETSRNVLAKEISIRMKSTPDEFASDAACEKNSIVSVFEQKSRASRPFQIHACSQSYSTLLSDTLSHQVLVGAGGLAPRSL